MSNAIVISAAFSLALLLFPIHISNYVYVDSAERYSSLNVCIYRYIKLFNVNSVKDKPNHMMVNGKDKQINFEKIKFNVIGVLSRLNFTKIIQLGDYGVRSTAIAYAALIQRYATNYLYAAAINSGSCAKYRNYTVLDQARDGLRYYVKVEIAINMLTIINIIIFLITEKLK